MHRTLSSEQPTVPISQFRIVEHKLGFKPVIGCSCGAILDKNKDRTSTKAFMAEHELCPPKVERSALVTQITQE